MHPRTFVTRVAVAALAGAALLAGSWAVRLNAQVPITTPFRAITVPWQGDPSLPHQVQSGGTLTLHGVFWDPNNTSAAWPSVCNVQWDPGNNGGVFMGASFISPPNIELTRVYTGTPGQPFTATLKVTLCDGQVLTDTMEIVIAPTSRETRVNTAIDKGLWRLHKAMLRSTDDGMPTGWWVGPDNGPQFHEAAIASAVQAFHVNGHYEGGDKLQNPYVDTVSRGMRRLLSTTSLKPVNIGPQFVPSQGVNQNPDTNGNNIGLTVNKDGVYHHDPYVLGQVIDAIVSSRTPNKLADIGHATLVKNRSYKDIVRDMVDAYSWGMNDTAGGWHYQWNVGFNDTSASHWWGIGVLAANVWGIDAPAWVKQNQLAVGIPAMQNPSFPQNCYFGYTGGPGSGRDGRHPEWDSGLNTTPAGLILLNADGVAGTDARWRCSESYIQLLYNSTVGNFYAMYQTTKAMRTRMVDHDANASTPLVPVPKAMLERTDAAGTVLSSTDWWAGYADFLVNIQNSTGDGRFQATVGTSAQYVNRGGLNMATAWGVIILSPALFEKAPTAVCKADSIVCAAGATCGAAQVGTYSTANFDGSLSTPGDHPIQSYRWEFQDGSPNASTVNTTHSFVATGTYNVKLTVTDERGHASSAVCPVTVTDTALPPLASAGPLGGYDLCVGRTPADSLILDATGSIGRGSNIVSYEWDLVTPTDFAAINATGGTTDQTAFFSALPPGPYNIGVRVTDDSTPAFKTTAFAQVRVRNALTDPVCNRPPLAADDAAATFSGVPVTVPVLSNDTDPDGNPLTVTGAVLVTPGGTPVVNANGTITFTPALGFAGVSIFKYDIKDSFGAISAANVTITVTKRTATVTAGSGTKVYGQADPPLTPASTGFDPADGITVTQLPRDPGENAGIYATHANATGTLLPNYAVEYVDGTFEITKADSHAVATGENVTYDGQQHPGTCKVTGVNDEVLPAMSSYGPDPGVPVSAGTHTLTCGFIGNDNYNPSSATATITIAKLAATVTAGSGSKTYGEADPTLTPTSSGFLAADLIVVTQTARDPGESAGTYATHAAASGALLGNYDVTTVDGTLTIGKATPTADATGETVTYDGQPHGGTCTVTGANGETLPGTSTYSSGTAPVAAGDHTLTCAFAGNDNYESASDTAAIVINKATATVTAGSGSKVYGQADPTFTPTSTGFLPADGIVVTQTPRDAGENVGNYATHASASGAALGNYTVTNEDGNLSIGKAPLTITADSFSIHYAAPMPTLTVTYAGFQFADSPASLGGTLSVTTLGTPFTLGPHPIIPSGVTSPNYAITFVNGTLHVGNVAPSCDAASGSVSTLWSPNHQMVPVTLNGATDADGDALTITVVSIFQDEAVDATGSGNTGPDGAGVGTSTAEVRSERVGKGNGRVYVITFKVSDAAGGFCTKVVTVSVPHDQRPGSTAVNDGATFDSTVAPPRR